MRLVLFVMNGNRHFLQQGAKQLFLVTYGKGGCMPQSLEIFAERERAASFLGAQCVRTELFASCEFLPRLLEFVQMLLPLRFKSACHQPVLRIDGAVPPLGALCFVMCPFDAQSPLRAAS